VYGNTRINATKPTVKPCCYQGQGSVSHSIECSTVASATNTGTYVRLCPVSIDTNHDAECQRAKLILLYRIRYRHLTGSVPMYETWGIYQLYHWLWYIFYL
jgi:hypothetical protein